MASKRIVRAVRSAVSPARARPDVLASLNVIPEEKSTPLTRFVLARLGGPSKDLFALSFAAQMSMDKHALVINLADALPWLGIERIDVAVRLLKRHFQKGNTRSNQFSTLRWKIQEGVVGPVCDTTSLWISWMTF